jgi:hypothetical protein
MKKVSALVVSIFLGTIFLSGTSAVSAENSVDESVKAMVAMQKCASVTQMDCIEKVTVEHADGTSKEVKLNFGNLRNESNMGVSRYEYQTITLNYEFGKSGGPTRSTDVLVNLKTQWIDIPTGGIQVPGFNIMFMNAQNLFETDTFVFVIRASWLKPQNVALYGKNAIFKEEKIPGGKRFTLGGSKLTQALFDDSNKYALLYKPEGDLLKADRVQEVMYFIIDHAAKYSQSAYSTQCADSGYPVASSNASSAGQPKLKGPNEIEYSIAAPHFKPDGTLFTGYFQADLNTKYLECVWPGNEISKSTEFSISVVNNEGVAQVATTAVSFKNNIISVKAFGFHYSAPTIKLEGNYGKAGFVGTKTPETSPSPTPSPSPVSEPSPTPSPKNEAISIKKTSIFCMKGKVTKKVTALNPKCPVGYKRK